MEAKLYKKLDISYPTAKKRLDELLIRLQLAEPDEEELNMAEISGLSVDRTSTKASEINKAKLKDCGGHVIVHTARGLPCEIVAHPDGKSFTSKKLPIKPPYEDEKHFTFTTVIETSPQFYGWLCGLGKGVHIMSPPEVVEEMGNYVKGIAEMY